MVKELGVKVEGFKEHDQLHTFMDLAIIQSKLSYICMLTELIQPGTNLL